MNVKLNELKGRYVQIVPMERNHIKEMYDIGQKEEIWRYLPVKIKTQKEMAKFVENALANKETGEEFPFVLLDCNEKVIGTTRFMDISNINRSLEIGWTWLTPDVWGTPVNIECKYLLLKYCFEHMKCIRVQLKTDELNLRSQKAIERIGGVREGILRNHMIRKDGSYRNSVIYSVIENDWGVVKLKLEDMLEQKNIEHRFEKTD